VACDNQGIPLHVIAARANDHDSPLLEPTLAGICDMIGPLPQHRGVHGEDLFPTVHLDRGYDSGKTRDLLHTLGFEPEIAVKGVPAPIQAGRRWPVERTHSPRVGRVELGAVGLDQGREFDPDGFDQGCWQQRHGLSE
jgi:hypothetical protein